MAVSPIQDAARRAGRRPSARARAAPVARAGRWAVAAAVAASACGLARADEVPRVDAQVVAPVAPPLWVALSSVERTGSPQLGRIGAATAWVAGATGRGVVVAVLDTGVSASHREFSGRVLTGVNTTGAGAASDANDRHGHGTHVAGLIAAAADGVRMSGVAYGATLLPVKVLRDDGSGHTGMMDDGLRQIVGRAFIANLSLSGGQPGDTAALQHAVRSGVLVVAAAGNDGQANPGWPARFARETWANGQIIAVGAVDANNRIASFSNRAGDAAAWFIVAPGTSLLSTSPGGGYVSMSGTSMAAPLVSGAAALVKSRWRYLRADQVANILLITATDLGARGIDSVYGRGLLNVDAAMKPVGNLTTLTWNGRRVRAIDTSVRPTPAVGGLWAVALRGDLRTIGFDDFSRDFAIDLGARVSRPAGLQALPASAWHEGRLAVSRQRLADGATLTLATEVDGAPAIARAAADAARAPRLLAFAWQQADADGADRAAGLAWADHYFGLAGTTPGQGLRGQPALGSPWLALLPGAAYAGASRPLATLAGGGVLRAKAGVLSADTRAAWQAQWADPADPTGPAAPMTAPAGGQGAVTELSAEFGRLGLSLGLTGTRETGRYLGAEGQGALALPADTRSLGATAALAFAVTPRLVVGAQVSAGRTAAVDGADGLIRSLSTQHTRGHAVALVAQDTWRDGDRWTLSLTQPLRAVAGSAVVDRIDRVDAQGQPLRARDTVSLVPDGRERTLEIGYGWPATLAGGTPAWAEATVSHRVDPGHQAALPAETAVGVRLRMPF
jgi:hypothetical protein